MTALTDAAAPYSDAPGGNQWMVDLHQCGRPALERRETVRSICLEAVASNGLTSVGDVFHQFEPHGVTGVVVLAESHLAIHTWPEHRFVSIDLYVCNLSHDNRARGDAVIEALIEGFGSKAPTVNRQPRAGVVARVPMAPASATTAAPISQADGAAAIPPPSMSW